MRGSGFLVILTSKSGDPCNETTCKLQPSKGKSNDPDCEWLQQLVICRLHECNWLNHPVGYVLRLLAMCGSWKLSFVSFNLGSYCGWLQTKFSTRLESRFEWLNPNWWRMLPFHAQEWRCPQRATKQCPVFQAIPGLCGLQAACGPRERHSHCPNT